MKKWLLLALLLCAGSAFAQTAVTVQSITAPATGQQTMANSDSVVIASDQVGTAGSAATSVFTVQGIASMTPLIVTANSGAFGSGSIASGALAAGSIAASAAAVGSFPNGAITPFGSTTDNKCTTTDTTACGLIGLVKRTNDLLGTPTGTQNSANSNAVVIASDQAAFTVNAAPAPATSGGLTNYVVEPGASDNHANIKNGAGQVYYIHAYTKHTAAQFMRLYNAASGFNGCNSATNIIWEGIIPAASTGAGLNVDISNGIAFGTGISICVTGAYGQTDTTSATASVTAVNIGYK